MDVLVLGPLELRRDGRPLPVRRGRPRRLLLSLLLRRGAPAPADALVDQLWGDEPPANADNALQILVSYLRKAVGGEGLAVERAGTGYRLVLDADSVDMVRFEAAVRDAGGLAADPGQQLEVVTRALAMWRGPALSEAADDAFAQGDIVRLDELRLQAQETRASALLGLGRHDDALPELGQLAREHPFREHLHGQLALALYRAGRQAEALETLDALRRRLVDELGIDPTPELLELGSRVLRQDPALDAPVRPDRLVTSPTASAPTPPHPAPSGPAGTSAPVPLTTLVGRDEQLAAISQALGRSRLVTLTGPGGTGKTRLAVELAATPRSAPVWWCDLAPAADAPAVAAAVAAAVGTALATDDDPARALQRWIGGREALLVLDTCEHVVEPVSRLVVALAGACPGLRVLATSRAPLGVPGELVRPVPPLSLPDADDVSVASLSASHAVQLFCDRAAAARPGFRLGPDNASQVAAVCLLLDGLPLALELAAGHVAALSPAKIAALLSDRMRLLGDGQQHRGRHAGLRAAVDWSYGLLSEDEAAFLDRLSVFAGPFPVEAAVEVAGPGLATDGLRLLLDLARQSLVSVSEDDRFRLLDTIRAYASAQLAARPDDADATADRHARWCTQFAEEADRNLRNATQQQGWLDDLRAASPDLRAALRHCLSSDCPDAELGARLVCALSWFWSFEGMFAEARSWIAQARAAGPQDPRLQARLRLAAGMHAESVGDLATAEDECSAALAAFSELGDVRGQARCLLHLGTVRWASGRTAQAAAAQERSVALFRSVRHDGGTGLGLVQRARTALDEGDTALAHELLTDARHVLGRTGDDHLLGLCIEQQARTHLYEGAPAQAEALARQSLQVFEAVGLPEGVLASLQTLAQARLDVGDAGTARELLTTAVQQAADLAHAPAVAEGLELLAEASAASDPAHAALLLSCASRLREDRALPRTRLQSRRLSRWSPGAEDDRADGARHDPAVEALLLGLGVVGEGAAGGPRRDSRVTAAGRTVVPTADGPRGRDVRSLT